MDDDWYWGDCGISHTDTAADVYGDFEEAIEGGASVAGATKPILTGYADYLDDMDGESDAYFALAAAQLRRGGLQNAIHDKAMAFIDSGQTLDRWNDEWRPKRQEVLQQFRALLVVGSGSL